MSEPHPFFVRCIIMELLLDCIRVLHVSNLRRQAGLREMKWNEMKVSLICKMLVVWYLRWSQDVIPNPNERSASEHFIVQVVHGITNMSTLLQSWRSPRWGSTANGDWRRTIKPWLLDCDGFKSGPSIIHCFYTLVQVGRIKDYQDPSPGDIKRTSYTLRMSYISKIAYVHAARCITIKVPSPYKSPGSSIHPKLPCLERSLGGLSHSY